MTDSVILDYLGACKISPQSLDIMRERMEYSMGHSSVEEFFDVEKTSYYYVEKDVVVQAGEDLADFKIVPVIGKGGDSKCSGFLFVATNNGWNGVGFGEIWYLKNRLVKFPGQSYCSGKLLAYLYNNLLDKECWDARGSWDVPFQTLRRYLLQMSLIARSKILAGGAEDVLVSKDGAKVLYDSNLLDKYGNRIFLVHDVNRDVPDREGLRLQNPDLVGSAEEAWHLGFEMDQFVRLPIFSVCEDKSQLIFDADVSVDQICDLYHMKHAYKERANRVPENLAGMSPFEFSAMVRASVDYALKRSKVDYNYVKPSYSLRDEGLCFLVPIYKPMRTGAPDFVLLLSKKKGMWVACTILTVEQAYVNARVLAPQSGWLTLK